MSVFINRALNLKKIKAVGFDMDHTIVRYHTEKFEELTHSSVLKKLVEQKSYPADILKIKFNYHAVIQGLVIDKKNGNLLKLSRFSKVKASTHGTRPIDFKEQQKLYNNLVVDFNDPNMQILDSSFSVAHGVLFAQLIDTKEDGLTLPRFDQIADDVREMLDVAHSDGTLKDEVRRNISEYIIQDPDCAPLFERFKSYGKKLLVITNSDYSYTKLLLDYTINPFLKEYKTWIELFDIVIVGSQKPRFFTDRLRFLSIDPNTGLMTNYDKKVEKGLFQGGSAGKLQKDLGLEGDEILYLGDHIYGDVVSIKKTFNWRTALVLESLSEEILSLQKGKVIQEAIDTLMRGKETLEVEMNKIYMIESAKRSDEQKKRIEVLYDQIDEMNSELSQRITEYQKFFSPKWGEMMRAGVEESRFADQVEKYACIYMARVTDLLKQSPRSYFRPVRRVLRHEQEL